MPDTSWISTGGSIDPDSDCTVFASQLVLRSDRDIPALSSWTADVTRGLQHARGLLGYAIAQRATARTLWTVSAWRHRADLLDFERSHPHRAAKQRLGDLLIPSTFAVWTCRTDQLPIGWEDVRARIAAIDVKAPSGPDRRPTNG